MTNTPEKIEQVIKFLNNKTPVYGFNWNTQFNDQLGDEFQLAHKEYVIYYSGNKTIPYDFKHDFARDIIETIQYLKKQKYHRNITNTHLQDLINELTGTIDTYELLNVRGKKFQYQTDASIWLAEENNRAFYTIESIPDYLFDDIVQGSQLKYDFTIKLIDGLKEILQNDKQIDLEKIKFNIDDFFDKIIDHDPCFSKDLIEKYVTKFNAEISVPALYYKGFASSIDYRLKMFENAKKSIFQFKKDYALNKINNDYLKSYLDALKFEEKSFVLKSLNKKEFLCHPNAYLTDYYKYLHEEKVDINELNGNSLADEFIAYNEIRAEIIQYLITEIETIITKKAPKEEDPKNSNEFSKLELDLSVPDIALLFRLLYEEGLLKYKSKTEIYQHISLAIKSSKQENISPKSLKNKFLSPDNSSLEKFDILLVNLRQKLKKIQ